MDNDNETVLDIQINKTGAYNVTVSNATWLTSAPTFLRYDNRTASTKNGTLTLNDISVRSGEDEIGRFRETSMVFLVSSARLRFYAFVKVYRNIPLVLFTQVYTRFYQISVEFATIESTCRDMDNVLNLLDQPLFITMSRLMTKTIK